MKKIVVTILLACISVSVMAQPANGKNTSGKSQAAKAMTSRLAQDAKPTVDRASLMFPTKDAMPEDVSWRRDIYRQLDLTVSRNAALYYPVEPKGQQMNLFTCIFRLILAGRLNAYTYKLDGNESFAEADKLNLLYFLDDHKINHEGKNGSITVADADIPSREVKRYYLKESTYLDQRTGTIHTKVVALCPILLDSKDDEPMSMDGEYEDEVMLASSAEYDSKPLFWVRYDDVAPYLAKLPVMASDQNNVTNMTAADYFNMNLYQGKIFKTNNMQGQTLADYCKTDSAMTKEQERIEKELKDFEEHLWGHTEPKAIDSTSVATDKKAKTVDKKEKKTTFTNIRRESSKKESVSSSSAAPRASARRQRR